MHLPAQRDNFANGKANTCQAKLTSSKQIQNLFCVCGVGCVSPKQKSTPIYLAADTVEAGECRESVRMSALLDEFTTYQVEGSVVDYLANDG